LSAKRRSYEAGHKPKYLVVIDESPECDRAVYYASRRAARTGASVLMLLVIEPHDRHHEDEDIATLVLAAGTGKDGPGPLVASLSKTAGEYPIPVAIVPAHLGDEELDALS